MKSEAIKHEEVGEVSEEGRKEVGKEEISELVEALKDAVMQLRETLSELNNPLARIGVAESAAPQAPGETVEREGGESEEETKEEKTIAKPALHEEKHVGPELGEAQLIFGPGTIQAATSEKLGKERPELSMTKKEGELNIEKVLRLLRLVFELRESVDPSIIEKYVSIYKRLGLVSDDESEVLKDLIDLTIEGSRYGLTVEDHVAVMALLAKTLGIQDKELEEESVKLLLKKVKEKVLRKGSGRSDFREG